MKNSITSVDLNEHKAKKKLKSMETRLQTAHNKTYTSDDQKQNDLGDLLNHVRGERFELKSELKLMQLTRNAEIRETEANSCRWFLEFLYLSSASFVTISVPVSFKQVKIHSNSGLLYPLVTL